MFHSLITAPMAVALGLLAAQAAEAASQDRPLAAFQGIVAQSSIHTNVVCGSPARVQLTVEPDSLLKNVESTIVDGNLRLEINGMHMGHHSIQAVVTTPTPLENFAAGSSAKIVVDPCALSPTHATVNAASSAAIQISGKTQSLTATAASSGRIMENGGSGLIADFATLTASSSGSIKVGAIVREINATASSSGQIADAGKGTATAEHASLVASSSGRISLCKVKAANVTVSSSGTVMLDKEAQVQSVTTSSGHVDRDACS